MSYIYWISNKSFVCWYKYFAGQGAIWLIQALFSPSDAQWLVIF